MIVHWNKCVGWRNDEITKTNYIGVWIAFKGANDPAREGRRDETWCNVSSWRGKWQWAIVKAEKKPHLNSVQSDRTLEAVVGDLLLWTSLTARTFCSFWSSGSLSRGTLGMTFHTEPWCTNKHRIDKHYIYNERLVISGVGERLIACLCIPNFQSRTRKVHEWNERYVGDAD